jgi:hypothetical protein
MNPDRLQFRERFASRDVSRRGFLQNAASAGAGLMIGSEIVPRSIRTGGCTPALSSRTQADPPFDYPARRTLLLPRPR